MDLYSLPKDILIKLIYTIREDTIKEYEEKLQKLDILEESLNINWCNYPNCKSFVLDHRYFTNDYYCGNCEEMFCEDHMDHKC